MKHDLFTLKGKVALVTGGYRGIGKTVAEYLADAGADIVLVDLQDASEVAESISREYGVRAASFLCDVTRPDQVENVVAAAGERMGALDILFNNAGIGPHKDALEVTPEEWRSVIDVNLNGIFYMACAFCRYLSAHGRKGSIINTASMSAIIVNIPQKQASYNASKAAVVHLTKTLAVEWVDKGVRVNCISPGYIQTDLIKNVRRDWQDEWISMIPFKRMGKPEELAGAVIYLASDASSYTSGSNIVIDGCFTVV